MTTVGRAVVDADPWLAEALGTAVFRVNVDAGELTEALRHHGERQPAAFYYAKVPTGRVAVADALQRAGFAVVDTAVGFELTGAGPPASPGIAIDDFETAQADAVLDIAGSVFRYSRFHLDPRVPDSVAHHVKREWIRSYVLGQRGDRLLVARLNGRPAGFLAVMGGSADAAPKYVIDLIGVALWAQRRGVARALVGAFVDAYRARGVLRVGTQLANLPSIRLYQDCGFVFADSQYVLHRHIGRIAARA